MASHNSTFSLWPTVTPKSLLPFDVRCLQANIQNFRLSTRIQSFCDANSLPPHTRIPVTVSYLKTVAVIPKKESRLVSPCSCRVWSVTRRRTACVSSSRRLPQREKSLSRKVQTLGCLDNPYRKSRKPFLEMEPSRMEALVISVGEVKGKKIRLQKLCRV